MTDALVIKLAARFDSDERAISNAKSEMASAANAETGAAATQNYEEVLAQVDEVTLEKLEKQFASDGEIFDEYVPDEVEDVFAVLKIVSQGKSVLIDAWLGRFEHQFNAFRQNCVTGKCHYNRPVYPTTYDPSTKQYRVRKD